MANWAGFRSLRLGLGILELISFAVMGGSVTGLKQNIVSIDPINGADVHEEASWMKCVLQGTPRFPAFSKGGDLVVGGALNLHDTQDAVIYNYTKKPEPPRCTGRLARRRGRKG